MKRLLKNGFIVGYVRKEGNLTLYSKDLYGWNGSRIDHDSTEEFTGFRDINNRPVFENDTLKIKYIRNPQALQHFGSFLMKVSLRKGKWKLRYNRMPWAWDIDLLRKAVSFRKL